MVDKAPAVVADATDATDDPDDFGLPTARRYELWQLKRPPIQHLSPALVSGLRAFEVGDRIVVDVRTSLLTGRPWLETLVGRVRTVDDDTGVASLTDENSDPRQPITRWVSYRDGLHEFRMAPPTGTPFDPEAIARAAKARKKGPGRGRPARSKTQP